MNLHATVKTFPQNFTGKNKHRLLAAAGVYQKEIADMLGVSKTIIGFAVIRRTWKHVL